MVQFRNVIYSLGIRGVGEELARLLSNEFGSMDKLIQANKSTLESIEGIGSKVSSNIIKFFNSNENKDMIEKLRSCDLPFYSEDELKDIHNKVISLGLANKVIKMIIDLLK